MPLETETSTTSAGGTTTVGATVRDGGGPGSPTFTLDVYLHLDPAKLEQVATPTSSAGVTPRVDKDRLSALWKDVKLPGKGSFKFNWTVKARSGEAFEGASTGQLVVVDRSTGGQFIVRRFCICGNAGRLVMFDKFGPVDFSDLIHKSGTLAPRKKARRKAAKKTRRSATRRTKKPAAG